MLTETAVFVLILGDYRTDFSECHRLLSNLPNLVGQDKRQNIRHYRETLKSMSVTLGNAISRFRSVSRLRKSISGRRRPLIAHPSPAHQPLFYKTAARRKYMYFSRGFRNRVVGDS